MRSIPNPLIDRLDVQIAAAEEVFERELLKSRRAALLARHGRFPEARFVLAGLRSQSQRLRNPVLSAWAVFVDGLIDHCESLSPHAREKFLRAHQLACATEDIPLRAETAAWLAVGDLNANDAAAMVAHVREVLRLAEPAAHAVQARVALVIGDAWRFAGEEDDAQAWYRRVRRHATAAGDVALVSALLYNKAAFRVDRISLDDAMGRADIAEARDVLLEAESMGSYGAGLGGGQLEGLVPILLAQLMVVTGGHAQAVETIDAHLAQTLAGGLAPREARLLADAAHAEVRLGRLDEAARRLRRISAAMPQLVDDDDIAATHARLAGVERALGRAGPAGQHERAAAEALARHEAERGRWVEALRAGGLEA